MVPALVLGGCYPSIPEVCVHTSPCPARTSLHCKLKQEFGCNTQGKCNFRVLQHIFLQPSLCF